MEECGSGGTRCARGVGDGQPNQARGTLARRLPFGLGRPHVGPVGFIL